MKRRQTSYSMSSVSHLESGERFGSNWNRLNNKKLRKVEVCLLGVWASLVAQLVKNPPAMQETWVRSLGWEDPLEEGKATHSSILAWRIPRTVVHGVTKSWTWVNDFNFHYGSHSPQSLYDLVFSFRKWGNDAPGEKLFARISRWFCYRGSI